jgi:hypothetical protein
MKRLLLLFVVLIVFLFSSSPLSAASKSLEYRIRAHVIMSLLYRNMLPIPGIYFGPEEILLITEGNDLRVGGDADDYANGKISPGPNEQKPDGNKVEGSCGECRGLTRGSINVVR